MDNIKTPLWFGGPCLSGTTLFGQCSHKYSITWISGTHPECFHLEHSFASLSQYLPIEGAASMAANTSVLNKQSWTANKGWSSRSAVKRVTFINDMMSYVILRDH
jgi:hypothetical protein